jgi:hypothetical protein
MNKLARRLKKLVMRKWLMPRFKYEILHMRLKLLAL